MLEVARRIERAAKADCPVMIWGERGAGKKMVAEMIHRRSRRRDGPLVVVSTQKSPGQPAEDEVFGTAGRPGRLLGAAGGTLLIDEITGFPPTGQAKLLDAAEGRHVAEVGDAAEQPLDFRLMATTRAELAESVDRGSVRADLYYRLTVVTIRVPSLRERQGDLPCLVQWMLSELCAVRGSPVPAVAPELVQHLAERPWPGNGHDLRDCLKRMLAVGDAGTLGAKHLQAVLPQNGRSPAGASSAKPVDTLADLERAAVTRALEAHQGNRTQAAKALGISVRTLQRKLKHWDL